MGPIRNTLLLPCTVARLIKRGFVGDCTTATRLNIDSERKRSNYAPLELSPLFLPELGLRRPWTLPAESQGTAAGSFCLHCGRAPTTGSAGADRLLTALTLIYISYTYRRRAPGNCIYPQVC